MSPLPDVKRLDTPTYNEGLKWVRIKDGQR